MGHRVIDPATLPGREPYFLLTGLVIPRPIAWVSTLAPDGTRNLAPHSFFNAVSTNPPVIHFTSTGVKDTLTNVRASSEFVVNIVSKELVDAMNLTAANFPPDEDEFSWAGLESAACEVVAPPRVALAKAAFECRVRMIVAVGDGNMVFGDVLRIHLDDEMLVDGRVDPLKLAPVARLSGSQYATVDDVYHLPRPTWDDVRTRGQVES